MIAQFVPDFCRRARLAMASWFLLSPLLCGSQSQPYSVLCSAGAGNFDSEFPTGVRVHIGATRNSGLATRTCTASLNWANQALVVAASALQVDLDAFGADLGDGIPVAAFQIKKSESDCCMDYAIYSLHKPPRLLRTITGGGFFSASDIDSDGTVEIFTDDAAAVDGFEKLALGELDSPPTVVFRFVSARLQDVSAEFQSYFDHQIAEIRSAIDSYDLEDFKNSDGALTAIPTGLSTERLHHLRIVKIKVLEIVWAYLYSGREQEAWRSLAEMWPPADIDRIRAALLGMRTHGIPRQADGVSAGPPAHKKKHSQVFDAVRTSAPGTTLEVVPPEAILLQRPPIPQQQGQPELLLELVVDRAGKVRSAEPVGKVKWIDPELVRAALSWKFIPALKDGRAVASRVRIAVSPRQ